MRLLEQINQKEQIKYFIFIDESGDHGIKNLDLSCPISFCVV